MSLSNPHSSPLPSLLIIGAGPSGLALAHLLSSTFSITIIDQASTIGGCHRVERINGLFTEHGPRIYSTAYKNLTTLINDMGHTWDDLFVKYNFNMLQIGGKTFFKTMMPHEYFTFAITYIKIFLLGLDIDMSMKDYAIQNNMSSDTINLLERMARLTDGAGLDRYGVHEFFSLFDQQLFYGIYQPRKPNDQGLFRVWREYLEKRGVMFRLNTRVTGITKENGVYCITTSYSPRVPSPRAPSPEPPSPESPSLCAPKLVLAMPPTAIAKLIANSPSLNLPSWSTFALSTEYNTYWCITFHWKEKLHLPKVYGFPWNDWGVAFIVLTDYMTDENPLTKTFISTTATLLDAKSSRLRLTVNEIKDADTIISEIFKQLNEAFGGMLPAPDYVIPCPGTHHNGNKWISSFNSYVSAPHVPKQRFELADGLYNLGTHNGHSHYPFTSFESAVTNSFVLANTHFGGKYKVHTELPLSVSNIIKIMVVIGIMVLAVVMMQKN